jgi:endonuclease G, mitochondrial
MDDCFYITNICPQLHAFNAGIWEYLEKKIREWAVQYDSLLIISAPVLETCTTKGQLTVPGKFYKIVYSIKYKKVIVFLMDSNLTQGSIYDYETSVTNLDSIVKIDYFAAKQYSSLRNSFNTQFWK